MTAEPIVYIVDDDETARRSVRALVRSMDKTAKTFASAEEFLDQFDPQQPGCLVTDVRMIGMSGIDLQEKLHADDVHLPVIVITAHAETPLTVQAVKQGAVTVLEKPCRDYELFDAIRAALAQDDSARKQRAHLLEIRRRIQELTPQEQMVLDLIIDGVANKVIAKRLDVSIRTVENRRQCIFEKTQTHSVAELVRLVVESRAAN